jgi:outer membrane protein insertion porin family
MKKKTLRLRPLVWLLGLSLMQQAQAFDPFTISDIRVDGLERISTGTVLTYLPVERGDQIDQARAANAMRALFKTGFFNDVTISRDGQILVIKVIERPAISKVTLVGNKDIKEPDLRKALSGIGLSEGEVYNRLIIDKVEQELTKQYYNRGKYNVSVKSSVKSLDRNRVEVTLTIAEGKASKIRHINVVGNKRFTDEEILEGFESRTSNWLSWYRRDDQYSKEKVQGDLEKLRAFYLDRGYVDFAIDSTQVSISPDKRNIYITANVTEGEVYKIRDTKLTGTFIVGQDALQSLVFLSPGDTFSRRRLEQTTEAIKAVLSNVGYAFADVQFVPEIDKKKREVGITFFVDPGKRVYVRRITFAGNAKTQDEVIRREMRVFEGGWFSQAAVDRSKIRLQRLGFFQDVKVETPKVAGSDDQIDIEVTLEERQSGNFQFGFGYSALSKFVVNTSLQQENFLGRGNRVGIALTNNAFSQRFDFSYFNPYWTDEGVSRGFNLSFTESDFGDTGTVAPFFNGRVEFSNVYSIPITETDRINLQIGVDQNKIRPIRQLTGDPITGAIAGYVDSSPLSYFDYVRNNGGNLGCPTLAEANASVANPDPAFYAFCKAKYQALRAQIGWARDTRNRFFIPTDGYYARLGAELTLPGSDLRYYKASGQFQKFFPLPRSFVFVSNSEFGYGDGYGKTTGLPFFENFFNGGVRSVRGYEDNSLGPLARFERDPTPDDPSTTIEGEFSVGGSFSVNQTFELLFPTPFAKDKESVRIAAFFDAGQVYEDLDAFERSDLRYSAGLSVQWQSPIAPIIINWAYPINDKPGDRIERLQFSFFNNF